MAIHKAAFNNTEIIIQAPKHTFKYCKVSFQEWLKKGCQELKLTTLFLASATEKILQIGGA